MIEQLSDFGVTGGGTGDRSLPSNGKQLAVAVKKQALRELLTENNVTVTMLIGNSASKERGPVAESDKVAATKRPSSEFNPPPSQASSAVNANGNLVYVRRKTDAEAGKVSSSASVTACSNTDLHLPVEAPVSNERVQPSSTASKPQVVACHNTHSSERPLRSPAVLMNLLNESTLHHPQKSGNIMPSVEDKSLLPHPLAKPGDTMSSTENKSPLPHPVVKSGNLIQSIEDKSLLPHPVGKSGNTLAPTVNKSPLPYPPVNSGNLTPSMEDKSVRTYPFKKSNSTLSSTENNQSPLPRPLGKTGKIVMSTENKSSLSQQLGKSGNTMPSTENKSPLPQHLGISNNPMPSTENKSPLPQHLGKSGSTMSSTENRSPIPQPIGNPGNIMPSVDNRSPLYCPPGKPGSIISSVENNHIRPVSITSKLDFAKESNTTYLQRHIQPQATLRGLDRSGHEEYLQTLHSLSSVELSRFAFELETRSIQLSMAEAKEIARLEMLNVMGKSRKTSISPIAQSYRPEKCIQNSPSVHCPLSPL